MEAYRLLARRVLETSGTACPHLQLSASMSPHSPLLLSCSHPCIEQKEHIMTHLLTTRPDLNRDDTLADYLVLDLHTLNEAFETLEKKIPELPELLLGQVVRKHRPDYLAHRRVSSLAGCPGLSRMRGCFSGCVCHCWRVWVLDHLSESRRHSSGRFL